MPGASIAHLRTPGSHARLGDALGDVGDEVARHQVGAVRRATRRVAEVERQFVVGVDAGRHHDVDVDLLVDALDARDEPAEPDDGQVDDGAHAHLAERPELGHGVGDPLLLVPVSREVLLDLGREHEHVLVHEGLAQLGGVQGAPNGGDLAHGFLPQGDIGRGAEAFYHVAIRPAERKDRGGAVPQEPSWPGEPPSLGPVRPDGDSSPWRLEK